MNSSHKNETHVRVGNGLMRFSGILLMFTSLVKFVHPPRAVDYMAFFGYTGETYFLIAGIEFAIAVLFLRASTRAVGLLLLSSYLGGAIAAHVAYHPLTSSAPILLFDAYHPYLGSVPPALVLVSAWVGAWLRHPEFFGRLSGKQTDSQLGAVRAA